MRKSRVPSLLLAVIMLSSLFTGCFDRREVDELAYVIAIGLDKGKTNALRMTLQIAVPRAIGGEGGEGGEEALDIVTLECPTMYSGLNMANTVISRQLNITHAKAIIFSREFAQTGLENLVTALPRSREFRPNIEVLVAEGTAEEFLNSIKPKIEINPAKFYELIFSSHAYTGFTVDTDFYRFYEQTKALFVQPVAIMAGVGIYEKPDDIDPNHSTAVYKGRKQPLEGDFTAGNVPAVRESKAEFIGLAVFDGGKMVGQLDGEETTFYSMVTGSYNHAYITLPDPLVKDKFVILDVRRSRNSEHQVNISGPNPVISVKVILEGDITVIQSGNNYEDLEKMPILEKAYEDYFRSGIQKMLEKTAREYKSDICGFGADCKFNFLYWKDWEAFGWLSQYPKSDFKVDVDVQIRRTGLMVNSSGIPSSDNPKGGLLP